MQCSQLSDDVRSNAIPSRVHKIAQPEAYGGWSKGLYSLFVILAIFLPPAGIILGIVGIASDSTVKKAQGKVVLVCSFILIVIGIVGGLLAPQISKLWNF